MPRVGGFFVLLLLPWLERRRHASARVGARPAAGGPGGTKAEVDVPAVTRSPSAARHKRHDATSAIATAEMPFVPEPLHALPHTGIHESH